MKPVACAAISICVSVASAQAPTRAALMRSLETCQLQGFEGPAFCGKFEVHEHRDDPHSRSIWLNVAVLPAMTDSVVGDPLVFLPGGGVVPATRYAGFLARAFPALRQHRDVLLVDQRGTWGSNPLACPPGGPPTSDAALVAMRQCRDSLVLRADLTGYTTLDAMDDLNRVREWLGYKTINLYGVSYGTKAAQVYVKLYPEHMRAVALYGVVPLSRPSQLDLARFAQTSLDTVFARCLADSGCRAAFPNAAFEFDSLLRRLVAQPATFSSQAPDGSPVQLRITDRAARDAVQGMLGSAAASAAIPLLVHDAIRGDYSAIARALGGGPPPPPGRGGPPPLPAPRGLFFSILCAESISRFKAEDVPAATRNTFFGDAPVRSQMAVCDSWPRATLPGTFWDPPRASMPVLAISGDIDPITPPAYAEAALTSWTNARLLVVSNRSHNDVDPCITSLFESFLIRGDSKRLDTSCAAAPAPLRFALPRPAP